MCVHTCSTPRTWHRDYRSRTADFEIHPADATPIRPEPGRFSVETPINRIIITWR
jgi:protein-L-isoaspartate(D-aspartate) O-methyltransferase